MLREISKAGDARIIGVIAETTDFLVLNKPAGLLSVPGKQEPDCLEARIQKVYLDAFTVHRLDMATSGICVMARGKDNLRNLQKQFERRKTRKAYEAIVWGRPTANSGTVDAAIRCDWPNRPLQMIDPQAGRSAITHWRVLGREQRHTRMELVPITGRSHQLRLHMKSIGHPILGDPWYAEGEAQAASPRLLLHARDLAFFTGATSRLVTYTSPSPF